MESSQQQTRPAGEVGNANGGLVTVAHVVVALAILALIAGYIVDKA
jgi:hypothetical protein